MIHVLEFLLKAIATLFFIAPIMIISGILSILFWDDFYLDKVGEYFIHLWES